MRAFEASVWVLSLENVLNAIGFVLEYAGLALAILLALEKELTDRYPSLAALFGRIRKGKEDVPDA